MGGHTDTHTHTYIYIYIYIERVHSNSNMHLMFATILRFPFWASETRLLNGKPSCQPSSAAVSSQGSSYVTLKKDLPLWLWRRERSCEPVRLGRGCIFFLKGACLVFRGGFLPPVISGVVRLVLQGFAAVFAGLKRGLCVIFEIRAQSSSRACAVMLLYLGFALGAWGFK